MADLAKFRLDLDPLGNGPVEVNGEDVSERVSGVTFECRRGQPSLLTLHHVAGSGPIQGEGIVQVVSGGVQSQQEAIVAFLASLDPQELERQTMDRLGMGDDCTMQVALEVLMEWANGRH